MSTPPLPQKSVSLRSFDDGLKLQVVRLVRDQKIPAIQVCRDFNIFSSLHRWLNQYDAERDGHVGSGAPITSEQRRIRAALRMQGCSVGLCHSAITLG